MEKDIIHVARQDMEIEEIGMETKVQSKQKCT